MANKGKLTSKLSVNGYKPDAIQYDNTANDTTTTTDETHPASKKKQPTVAKIDDYIKKVSSYRAGGDGAKFLKILLAYIHRPSTCSSLLNKKGEFASFSVDMTIIICNK